MIVKNEAHCIKRCLDSVKPIIDAVVINDNGSTDGTQEKIFEWCMDNKVKPFEVFDMPWKSFDENRSAVLEKLYKDYKDIDYVLMIDADEVLVFDAGFNPQEWKESLNCDLYDIESRLGGTKYLRPQLSSNHKKFCYKGVVHETIHPLEEIQGRATVSGFFNMPIQDSARNKDPDKFKKDAEALQVAFDNETDPFLKSRYCFYLAQSYKDQGAYHKAIPLYLTREGLGYWHEERYMSLVMASRLMKHNKYSYESILPLLIRGIEICPYRAEAYYEAMTLCKDNGFNMAAYAFGVQGTNLPVPKGSLFVEEYLYTYQLNFEVSILAYYVNRKDVGKALTEGIIKNEKAPNNFREQSKINLGFYPSQQPPLQ